MRHCNSLEPFVWTGRCPFFPFLGNIFCEFLSPISPSLGSPSRLRACRNVAITFPPTKSFIIIDAFIRQCGTEWFLILWFLAANDKTVSHLSSNSLTFKNRFRKHSPNAINLIQRHSNAARSQRLSNSINNFEPFITNVNKSILSLLSTPQTVSFIGFVIWL